MDISINDLMDKYNNELDLTLLENKIVHGQKLIPLGKDFSFKSFLSSDFNKFDLTYNENDLIHLDDNNIYFVIEHYWPLHFHHEMSELIYLIQFFINELKNNRINNKNIKVISNQRIYNSNFMKLIKSCFDDSDFFYTDNTKYYKGHFLYYSYWIYAIPLTENNIFKNNYFSIIENLKNIAYQKYKDHPFYDKLWISRRNLNIETYWHKRFNTSIIKDNKISNFIKNNGFFEIHFPTSDLLYQVYLMMNVKIVFAEIGTSCNNMYFMNKGIWISDYDAHNISFNILIQNIALINNILLKFYPTIPDTESIYYNSLETLNRPYKFENDDKFIEWFYENNN
jgi:hypothetical protein